MSGRDVGIDVAVLKHAGGMIFAFLNNSTTYKLNEVLEFDLDGYIIEDDPYATRKVVNIAPKEKFLINIVKRGNNRGRGSCKVTKS